MIAISRSPHAPSSLDDADASAPEQRWTPAATVAFVLCSSLSLWAAIIAAARTVFG